jgi:rubredoxin
MKSYECSICGYVYDPANGDSGAKIPPHTAFEDLPGGWVCPICGAGKDQFTVVA